MPQEDSHIFQSFSLIAHANLKKETIAFKHISPDKSSGNHQTYASLTYAQIYQKAVKFGNILKDLKVNPEDNITMLLENQPEYAIAFLAIMYNNACAVPLDIQFSPQQIKQLIFHSESKILILNQKIYTALKNHLNNIQTIIVDSIQFQEQLESYKSDDNFTPKENSKNSTAVLFYTSGTTDLPKAVMLTHSNLLSNFNSLKQSDILRHDDIIISILPLHHAYPFTVTFLTPLLIGAKIVYPMSMASEDLFDSMRENNATIFVGVPQIFSLMRRSIKEKINALSGLKRTIAFTLSKAALLMRNLTGINLNKYIFSAIHKKFGPNLRFIASGGARLDAEIASDFFSWGFTMLEGYGLTETSPVVTFNPLKKAKFGSVGKPIPQVEVKILKSKDEKIGEVAIKGPNVMAGYYHMPRQTKEVIKDGWFLSGDLGYFDKEGYLYLTGRKKEIIVLSSGKNINPEELERHYLQSPFIKEICVLPIKASGFIKGVEHLAAIIVIDEEFFRTKGETNIRDKLKWELDSLSTHIPTYKRIRGFVISKDELPRTRLGKIMRHRIEYLYAELLQNNKPKQEYLTQEDINILYSDVSKKALNFLKETLKREVSINDHLELDLGLDSLGRVELFLGLQNHLNIEISDDEAADFFMSNTIKELLIKLKNIMPGIIETAKEEKSFVWKEALEETPPKNILDKINLNPGPLNILINIVAISFVKLFTKIFFFSKVDGRENLPENGPYLICPNHTTYLDGLFILAALPFEQARKTYFVGYSIFFEHYSIRWLIKLARLIPLEVSFNLVEALRACSYVLKHSKSLCYFPEGQRSIDGEVKEFKKGIGILINEQNIPVVPVYIDGAFRAWPRYRKFPRPRKVKIKIGKALPPDELTKRNSENEEAFEAIAKNLRNEVIKLQQSK